MSARGFPAPQVGPLLEELGPSQAQEEHLAVDPLGDRVGEVEHRPLRPVQVLEHHHERPLGGDHLEQAPDRPGRLRGERLTHAEELREPIAHRGGVRLTDKPFAEPLGDLLGLSPGTSRRLGQQLDQRRERDAVAVGGGLPDEDRREVPRRLTELRGQSRLPDPRRRQDRDEDRRTRLDRIAQRLAQHRQVTVASDQRRLGACGDGLHPQHPEGRHRLGLALGVDGLDRLGDHVVADQAARGLPDPDLARLGLGLQPRGRVHRVADDRGAIRGHEHLTGRDPDAGGERDRRVLVRSRQALLHLDAGPDRAKGIVLVGDR